MRPHMLAAALAVEGNDDDKGKGNTDEDDEDKNGREGERVNEHTDERPSGPADRPGPPADQLSDRDAGGLLLAFLIAVILVLAVGTVPLSADVAERSGETIATVPGLRGAHLDTSQR